MEKLEKNLFTDHRFSPSPGESAQRLSLPKQQNDGWKAKKGL